MTEKFKVIIRFSSGAEMRYWVDEATASKNAAQIVIMNVIKNVIDEFDVDAIGTAADITISCDGTTFAGDPPTPIQRYLKLCKADNFSVSLNEFKIDDPAEYGSLKHRVASLHMMVENTGRDSVILAINDTGEDTSLVAYGFLIITGDIKKIKERVCPKRWDELERFCDSLGVWDYDPGIYEIAVKDETRI